MRPQRNHSIRFLFSRRGVHCTPAKAFYPIKPRYHSENVRSLSAGEHCSPLRLNWKRMLCPRKPARRHGIPPRGLANRVIKNSPDPKIGAVGLNFYLSQNLADLVVDHKISLAVKGSGVAVDEHYLISAEIADKAGGRVDR